MSLLDLEALFLDGPDPATLPTEGFGSCYFCDYCGKGPGHNCATWNEHHALADPAKDLYAGLVHGPAHDPSRS